MSNTIYRVRDDKQFKLNFTVNAGRVFKEEGVYICDIRIMKPNGDISTIQSKVHLKLYEAMKKEK